MEDPIPLEIPPSHKPEVGDNSESEAEYDLPDMQDVVERLNDVTRLSDDDDATSSSDISSQASRADSWEKRDSDSPEKQPDSETSSVGGASNSETHVPNPFMEMKNDEISRRPKIRSPEHNRRQSEVILKPRKRVTIDMKRHSIDSNSNIKDTEKSSDCNNETKSKSRRSSAVKGFIKRLTSKTKPNSDVPPPEVKQRVPTHLPQIFVVKYMGKRECSGLWGVNNIRKPLDEMVVEITKQFDDTVRSVELPLMYAVVSHKGIDLKTHKNNKVVSTTQMNFPIDFISYGVQDVKFTRIFTFIVVQEMSSRSKKLECHALICDSPEATKSVALSLSTAFKVYMKQLESQGKQHRFQVELRPLNENCDEEEEDC